MNEDTPPGQNSPRPRRVVFRRRPA